MNLFIYFFRTWSEFEKFYFPEQNAVYLVKVNLLHDVISQKMNSS
jgi:hypothetical protein